MLLPGALMMNLSRRKPAQIDFINPRTSVMDSPKASKVQARTFLVAYKVFLRSHFEVVSKTELGALLKELVKEHSGWSPKRSVAQLTW